MRFLSLVVGCLPAVAFCGGVTLVGNGRVATVVLPVAPEESSRLAAVELTNHVHRITGRLMPVATEAASGPVVRIGTVATLGSDLPDALRTRLDKMTKREAAVLAAKDDTLWIVGKNEVAELYATYHFLESKFGVRWFLAPSEEDPGDWLPHLETMEVAAFGECYEPCFDIRRFDAVGCLADKLAVKGMTTAVRNGYQVFPNFGNMIPWDRKDSPVYRFFAPRVQRSRQNIYGGGHQSFELAAPADKCFDAHPEYFAEVDGKRVKGGQYCISNPELRRLVAERIIRCFDKLDGQGRFHLGMVDTAKGSCTCAACRALDDSPVYGSDGVANVSARYFKTVNDIAARVWEKYPKADISTWAYDIYRAFPNGVVPDRRFKIQFCSHGRCLGHVLDDPKCARNVANLALLKQWLSVSDKVFLYDYTAVNDPAYQCRVHDEAHDLRLYRKLGLIGWKNEAHYSDAVPWPQKSAEDVERRREVHPSNWQWLYVTGKLLWNPDLDEDELLAEAEEKYYGPAYPAMRKYQDLRRKLWANNATCFGFPYGNPRMATLLDTPGAKEELLGYLDEAERQAGATGVFRRRVGMDRKWLQRYWIAPNDIVRAKAGKAFRAVRATTPIKVDGIADEGAWAGAFYTDELTQVYDDGTPVPEKFKTTFGIVRDADNLYFLVKAKEPDVVGLKRGYRGPAWASDGVELFLFPPAMENVNYHLAANPNGNVSAAKDPGGVQPDNLGVTAAGKIGKDSWTLEIKVPVRKIYPLKDGDTWKVLLARNRRGRHWSSDGQYFETSNYRPMTIGDAYLYNGTFGKLDEKGMLANWDPHGGVEVVPSGGAHAAKLNGGYIVATMAHGKLAQSDKPRALRYVVSASGPGSLSVSFGRYSDTPDEKAAHGYRRTYSPPAGPGETFAVGAERSVFSGEHTVPAGEWNSIVVYGDGVTVYSVTVLPQ